MANNGKSPDALLLSTSESSPGGFFSASGGSVGLAESAAGSAASARDSAAAAKADAEAAAESARQAALDSDGAKADAAAAALSADAAAIDAAISKSWAVGPNGSSDTYGTDDSDTGAGNAKYWSDIARNHAGAGDTDGALHFATYAKGWAVGDSDAPWDTFDSDNNAKYFSDQAKASADGAKADSEEAATSAANALQSAMEAADSAEAAALDSEEAMGWAVDTEAGTQPWSQNSSKWWAQVAQNSVNVGTNVDSDFGITLDTETNGITKIGVDTEVIADTEWVKAHYTGNDFLKIRPDETDANHGEATISNTGVDSGIAIGPGATVASGANEGIAIGIEARAGGAFTTAIGSATRSNSMNTTAMGDGVTIDNSSNDSVGIGATIDLATAPNSVAIGSSINLDGSNQLGMGYNFSIEGNNSIGIGSNLTVTGNDSLAIGESSQASGDDSIAIGISADATGQDAISVGHSTEANAKDSVALGHTATVTGEYGISIGSVSSGKATTAAAENAIAIGRGADAEHVDSIALGRDALTDTEGQLVIDNISAVRTPDFVGGPGQFITVDANGRWSLATAGGNTPGHITFDNSLDVTGVTVGTAINRTGTVTATANGATVVVTGIVNANISQGTVTISGTSMTVNVPSATAGTIRLTYQIQYTEDGAAMTSGQQEETISVSVAPERWYAGLSTTSPTAFSDLNDEGNWEVGSSAVFDNSSGTETIPAWAFIPTSSLSTAVFHPHGSGIAIVGFAAQSTVVGDHTLIRFDGTGVDAGEINTFDVGEV